MDKKTVLSIVERFRIAIEAQGVRVSKIVLFGSYANGTAREDSDIDLVVISDDFARMGYWARIEITAQAIAEVWEPIESVAMTQEEWDRGDSMIVDFAKSGELVYSG